MDERPLEPHWVENIEELYDSVRNPKYFCTAEYACVRLIDCPYHLDKTYLYRIPDDCRYHIRTGNHDMTLADWRHYLDFADQWL